MGKEAFVREIINRCCLVYFRELNPKKIGVILTSPKKKFDGKRRLMGIYKRTKSKTILQMDKQYVENADIVLLVEKIVHELAHLKLSHPEKLSSINEYLASKEVKKFFKFIKKYDNDLIDSLK